MILLGKPYFIKDGVVYWRNNALPKADPLTFQHLGGDWARDAQYIYVQNSMKTKIDIATFQYLNPAFVKDANAVHDWKGEIKGADASTFEVLDPGVYIRLDISTVAWVRGFARDAHAVYYHDQMFGRATVVRGADPKTFISLRNDYGIDSTGVWLKKTQLANADPATWVYLGQCWSMDRDRIYYGSEEVTGIDRESFTVVQAPTIGSYSTDGEQFFNASLPILEKDFWADITDNFSRFEQHFRVAFHKIRGTCTTCHGTADCYCKRKGLPETDHCPRCEGSRQCHVCKGMGWKANLRSRV